VLGLFKGNVSLMALIAYGFQIALQLMHMDSIITIVQLITLDVYQITMDRDVKKKWQIVNFI